MMGMKASDFDPNDVIGRKAARRMDLYSQYALQSAIEAVEMAEINETNTKPVDNYSRANYQNA